MTSPRYFRKYGHPFGSVHLSRRRVLGVAGSAGATAFLIACGGGLGTATIIERLD